MEWKSGLRIVHNKFQTFDSSSSLTNFYPENRLSNKAFTTFHTFDSSPALSNFQRTGYIITLGGSQGASDFEYAPILEKVGITVIVSVKEYLNISDGVTTNPVKQLETSPISDKVLETVIVSVLEKLTKLDSVSAIGPYSSINNSPISESVNVLLKKTPTENAAISEKVVHFAYIDKKLSCKVAIGAAISVYGSAKIAILKQIDTKFTTNTVVLVGSNRPVTVTTDPNNSYLANPANPFLPTVIIGGQILFYNPATLPPTYQIPTETAAIFESVNAFTV